MAKFHVDGDMPKFVEEKLKQMYLRGLSVGARAMCQTISEKMADTAMSSDEKVKWVVDFCKPLLGDAKPKEEAEAKKEVCSEV